MVIVDEEELYPIPFKNKLLGRPKLVLFVHPHYNTGISASIEIGCHETAAVYVISCINTLVLPHARSHLQFTSYIFSY